MDNAQPITAVATSLDTAGLPVFCVDDSVKRQQIFLAVCATRGPGGARTWKYARPEEFAKVCSLAA